MREYDPNKLLIHLHIMKTGGSSLRSLLYKWFPKSHYFTIDNICAYKETGNLSYLPGSMTTWHFNRKTMGPTFGLPKEENQYVTFLRDPFDRLLSLYYYWKQVNKGQHIHYHGDQGCLSSVANSIEQFMRKNPVEFNYFLPDGGPEMFDDFVFVGVVERMQDCTDALAKIIGKPKMKIGHEVKSRKPYKKIDYSKLRRDYRKIRPDYYEQYEYVVKTWSPVWNGHE